MVGKGILIAGCGEIGIGVAEGLAKQGLQVFGLRRQPPKHRGSMPFFTADLTKPATLACLEGYSFSQLLYIVSPAGRSVEDYRQVFVEGLKNLLVRVLAANPEIRVTFISSTRVYGRCSPGCWVDLLTPVSPADPCAEILCQGEQIVCDYARQANIVRFSGIYGPGRLYLLHYLHERGRLPGPPGQWTNRIHAHDCVGFLVHLLMVPQNDVQTLLSVYLASDDFPVRNAELAVWMSDHFSLPLMATDVIEKGDYGRRIDNTSLRRTGYHLSFPGFREGYASLFWRE